MPTSAWSVGGVAAGASATSLPSTGWGDAHLSEPREPSSALLFDDSV